MSSKIKIIGEQIYYDRVLVAELLMDNQYSKSFEEFKDYLHTKSKIYDEDELSEEYDRGRDDGYDYGCDDGYGDGYNNGYSKAKEELENENK